jgi:hypothetical protein
MISPIHAGGGWPNVLRMPGWLITTDGHAILGWRDHLATDSIFEAAPDKIAEAAQELFSEPVPHTATIAEFAKLQELFGPPEYEECKVCTECKGTGANCWNCYCDGYIYDEPKPRKCMIYGLVVDTNLIARTLEALEGVEYDDPVALFVTPTNLHLHAVDWVAIIQRINVQSKDPEPKELL